MLYVVPGTGKLRRRNYKLDLYQKDKPYRAHSRTQHREETCMRKVGLQSMRPAGGASGAVMVDEDLSLRYLAKSNGVGGKLRKG